MPWLGIKKLALVPLYRPHAIPPDVIPNNWSNLILERMLFYIDPRYPSYDRSLRAYIHAASSGLADFDCTVLPMQTFDQQNVLPGDLDPILGASLRAQGFDCAALVMLGGVGAGTSAGFWVRFVMAEDTGVWAMEFMHSLTGFADLYPFGGNMDNFDEMDSSNATHPSAYTKRAIKWIDPNTVVQHSQRANDYTLHYIGLKQPPPYGRYAAVQIGTSAPYLMVEARRKVDQWDINIPSEGVIVYRVQTTDPLGHAQNATAPVLRLTPTALLPGQSIVTPENLAVSVTGTATTGYTVLVDNRNLPFVSGQLLVYRDFTRNGTGDVDTPGVIGLGGWQSYTKLWCDGTGAIYAVDTQGRLLFYRDTHRDGTGELVSPAVIGLGGWQNMKFVFSGDPGIIYAVNQQGQLLFYRDNTQNGTGDVDTPSVIGLGGWQQFIHLFYGGNGIIYAVNPQGQLLFYRDRTRNGTGDVDTPSVIGLGGWQQFGQLFSGGNGVIYAVNQQGQLLFYRDNNQDGTGDVDTPSIIGLGGWQSMKFLFNGGVIGNEGIIYAVPA